MGLVRQHRRIQGDCKPQIPQVFQVDRVGRTLVTPAAERLGSIRGGKTGAPAGDTFMSLIPSAELNGVEPFEYLLESGVLT